MEKIVLKHSGWEDEKVGKIWHIFVFVEKFLIPFISRPKNSISFDPQNPIFFRMSIFMSSWSIYLKIFVSRLTQPQNLNTCTSICLQFFNPKINSNLSHHISDRCEIANRKKLRDYINITILSNTFLNNFCGEKFFLLLEIHQICQTICQNE